MRGGDYMVPRQTNHKAEDGSQRRTGLNYVSTHYVSEGTYTELKHLQLKHRQSDVYADLFSTGAGVDNEGLRESVADAYSKLWSVLGDPHAQSTFDKRYAHLGMAATKAGVIRDKLDMVWTCGDWAKWLAPKAVTSFMLMKRPWEFWVEYESIHIPKRVPGEPKILSNYSLLNLNTSPLHNFSYALPISWMVGDGIKKLHDQWQPQYFTGLEDNRRDMARLAESFLANSAAAKATRTGGVASAALVQTYGEGGRDFLESVMNEVDYRAYMYMEALQRSTSKPLLADEHLAETAATSESVGLTVARLEEARFINTFTDRPKGERAVVGYLRPGPDVLPGADVLMWAKDPRKKR